MVPRKSILIILFLSVACFCVINATQVQSATCTVEIINSNISGTLAVNSPVTFNVFAKNSCGAESPIYYKYYYRANYGTQNYERSPWVKMTTADYVTDSEINYTFRTAGKYIVVIWAFPDPNNLDANGVSLIGYSVDITAQGGTACPVDIPHLGFTGLLVPESPITISVNASQRCGGGTMYYKYFYQAGYGTPSYGNNWVQMNTGDYVTDNEITYSFPSVGNYIIVVWAVSDPNNVDTTSVPIIGANLIIGDGTTLDMIFDLGEATVNMPTSGNILMQITEPGGIGSATYYGTQKANGPDFPLTGILANTENGQAYMTFDSQERVTQITLGSLEGVFTYNTNGTFNFELRKNGVPIYKVQNVSTTQRIGSVHVPPSELSPEWPSEKKRPLLPLTRGMFGAIDFETVARKVTRTFVQQQTGQLLDENHPFVQRLLNNADFQAYMNTYCVLFGLHERLAAILNLCESEHCKDIAGKSIIKLAENTQLIVLGIKTIIDIEYEDYSSPPAGAKVYEGPVTIAASACGGTDTWRITLSPDGTANVHMTFSIVSNDFSCSSCNVTYDNPRDRPGTYDKNLRTWQMTEYTEYPIEGSFTDWAISGTGMDTSFCPTQYSFTLRRVQ